MLATGLILAFFVKRCTPEGARSVEGVWYKKTTPGGADCMALGVQPWLFIPKKKTGTETEPAQLEEQP